MPDLAKLVDALAQGGEAERRSAAESLARLGEDAQGAIVPLVEALDVPDDQLRDWVVAALEGVGPPSESDVPALAARVTQPALDSAYWAATLLGRLGSAAAPAVPALSSAVAEHPESPVRERATWALGKIGKPAAKAREALEAAAKSGDVRLARLAAESLSKIDG